MSSSSYQPSAASPIGPSTSSTSTRNSKLDQIIQNFYTKTAQIVIQARCTPDNDARYGRRTSLKGSLSSRKLNKWFNIATEDVEILREDLKFWRTMAIQSDKPAPPMIIDIYLDTSRLSHNQSLLVADDNLRWSCVELKSQTTDSHINRILIESWELTLNQPFPDYAVDLPNLYKRSILFFRSLHSLARLLPTYDLYRKLQKLNDSSNPLTIGYRLSTTTATNHASEISLGSTILESDARTPTKVYEFSNIVTPIGTFKLNVTYRRNCDFRVEDKERDLSAQFIDMDEQFFTPTMAKYQQQLRQSPKSDTSRKNTRPASMFNKSSTKPSSLESKLENALYPDDDSKASMEIRQHTSSALKMTPYSGSGASSIRNLSPTNSTPTSRRASAPFVVSPFKSPFLSSSPQADSIFSGAGSGGSNKNYIPTSSERSRPVAGTTGNQSGMESGSYSRKIEFSSSFDKYKSSPTNKTTTSDSPSSVSMMRRWSKTSDHSSINIKNDHDEHDDLEAFVKLVGSNQELRMFQQPNRSSTQLLSSTSESNSSTSSMMIGTSTTTASKKTALSHFQNLRDTHNSLSESLSSSMMINASQHHEPVSGVSPVSSTSSTGRSYQPIIPSPLHAEQKSTSPVHIPRSLPQLRPYPQNALRLARLNPAPNHKEEEDDDEDDDDDLRRRRLHDMSAFSTYPQGNHHPDLHLLRNATTGHSGYHTGNKLNTPRRQTHVDIETTIDDDDSLVFKMSELDGSPPPSPAISSMVKHHHRLLPATTVSPPGANNNRVNEQFLELTPTPLSPPLLQAISMSTVKEEEEKSNTSGASDPRQ